MDNWQVTFERAERDGGQLLSVAGEIDLAVASQFAQQLEDLIDRGPQTAFVDLSRVEFMDSSGVRELLRANLLARERGREFVLVSPSSPCRHVLHVSGAWDEFHVRDAVND
jgi:anti-anti-sigma factor